MSLKRRQLDRADRIYAGRRAAALEALDTVAEGMAYHDVRFSTPHLVHDSEELRRDAAERAEVSGRVPDVVDLMERNLETYSDFGSEEDR